MLWWYSVLEMILLYLLTCVARETGVLVCHTCKMELFVTTVNDCKQLTIFKKSSMLDVNRGTVSFIIFLRCGSHFQRKLPTLSTLDIEKGDICIFRHQKVRESGTSLSKSGRNCERKINKVLGFYYILQPCLVLL